MKKMIISIFLVFSLLLMTNVKAASVEVKNNKIDGTTSIENDLEIMDIPKEYYGKTYDNSDYDRITVIGIWEYYYNDDSIQLFIYLFDPYLVSSLYKSLENNTTVEFRYNNVSFVGETKHFKTLGGIKKLRIENKISTLSDKERNYIVDGLYNNNENMTEIAEFQDNKFEANFTNEEISADLINVKFNYNGYMFIYEKKCFRIEFNAKNYNQSLNSSAQQTLLDIFGNSLEASITPELFTYNFSVPEEYNLNTILEIDFMYKYISYTNGYLVSPTKNENYYDNSTEEKRKTITDLDYTENIEYKINADTLNLGSLKMIDTIENRKESQLLNSSQTFMNYKDLDDFCQYDYSVIFDNGLKEITHSETFYGIEIYDMNINHNVKDVEMLRINYNDNDGINHNVIVNQGQPIDSTTITVTPVRELTFLEWLILQVKTFYLWLFDILGITTFGQKALVVVSTIIAIPVSVPLIILLIKLPFRLIKKLCKK